MTKKGKEITYAVVALAATGIDSESFEIWLQTALVVAENIRVVRNSRGGTYLSSRERRLWLETLFFFRQLFIFLSVANFC